MALQPIGPTFFPPLGPARMSSPPETTGWGLAMLADQAVPGESSITRGEIKVKRDKKSKAGADGSRPTKHGLDCQPLTLEVLSRNDDERERLAALLRPLVPQPNKTTPPVSFDHPSTRYMGIATVEVVGCGAMLPVPGKPGHSKTIVHLEHWLPSSKKSATNTATEAVRNIRKGAQKALGAYDQAKAAVLGVINGLHL